MRTTLPELRPSSFEGAVALLETLDRVEELSLAYDVDMLGNVGEWLERARDAAERGAPFVELEAVRRGLEDALSDAAARRADALTAEHAPVIDAMVNRASLLGTPTSELALLLVDARSPDIPEPLCSRVWPISAERASELAEDLDVVAPETAEWLRGPGEPDEHRVVAFTLGRFMRTTRRNRSYADA